MGVEKSFKKLCTPAMIYFVISMIFFIIALLQNFKNKNQYNLGNFQMNVPDITIVFICKLVYILFWTYVLNLICKDGHKGISWLLILFPFILLFVIIGAVMINRKKN